MELVNVSKQLPPFALDLLRLAIWLLLLVVVFVPLEHFFSAYPRRGARTSIRDVAYYFLSSMAPKTLLILPITLVAWLLHLLVPAGVHSLAAQLPWWGRFSAALVVGELGFYWGHRWAHQIPFLWRFHAIHHSAEEMTWLINTRAHPLDIVFIRLCGLVPMYALGLAQPVGRRLDMLPLIILLFGTLWGFFIHANVKWRFGWLESMISTPAFHHWHHTNDCNINKNYASTLPFLDRLFGTWYLPAGKRPTVFGCDTAVPPTLLGELLQPLVLPGSNVPDGQLSQLR